MLKLSAIAVAGTTLIAATNTEVETFLKQQIGANPAVKSLDVKVVDKKALDAPKGWDALIINLKAEVKQGSTTRPITQSMIYFTSGDYITADLTNIKTGAQLKNEIAPSFKKEFYKEANLIYGNKNAKHKIAIFSDPLCPFCRRFVPDALKYMKEYPDSFAVYYYHLPLESLHPAAVTLTRAAIAAELKGKKDVVLDMYSVEINAKETDEQKILDAFNKQLGTKITIKDIHAPEIEKQSSFDMSVVQAMMVNGTPTVFFDGKKDGSKSKYKAVKVK
jgi:thiol:disulfide interchange protein DsbC